MPCKDRVSRGVTAQKKCLEQVIVMIALKQKIQSLFIAVSVVLLGCFSAHAVADGTAVKIMPLGDSITRGYYGSTNSNGYRKPLYLNLTNNGYNVDFVGSRGDGDFADRNHEGRDGWHAAGGTGGGLLPNVYNWLVANPPDIVLLHIGTNDIMWEDEDANEVSDILDVIDDYEVANNKDITVVLALIINRQFYSLKTTQFNNSLNYMALNRIANGDDIIIVDMESALNYSTDMADYVHPNDLGYAKMADVWYDALHDLLNPRVSPTILSLPVKNVAANHLYTYDVNANGYPDPKYTLTTQPAGMTIEPNTGLIEWIPATAGHFDVGIKAANGNLPDAIQNFTVTVSAIKFDAASSRADSNDGKYLKWTHAIGAGSDGILVVGTFGKDSDSCDLEISSVKYNDINMLPIEGTRVMAASGGCYIKSELYYLLDANLPSSGIYDVEVTYKGSVMSRCGCAMSLENAEQQTAEAAATDSNEDTDSISTPITASSNGALIVDMVGCDSLGVLTAVGEDMVRRWYETSADISAAGSTKLLASAGSTTMSWNLNGGYSTILHSLAAFAPARPTIITGHVMEPDNTPISNVLISADPNETTVTTDANGYYEVLVPYGWSGTVTLAKMGCLFKPSRRTYSNVTANQTDKNYENISAYDLDDNGSVDWSDVQLIREYWLNNSPDIKADFNKDGIVNALDFAEFALIW